MRVEGVLTLLKIACGVTDEVFCCSIPVPEPSFLPRPIISKPANAVIILRFAVITKIIVSLLNSTQDLSKTPHDPAFFNQSSLALVSKHARK
jgi:hypothetical protein